MYNEFKEDIKDVYRRKVRFMAGLLYAFDETYRPTNE